MQTAIKGKSSRLDTPKPINDKCVRLAIYKSAISTITASLFCK